VFLDAALTSPYDFYQYWLNDDDELVAQHLRWLTLMTADDGAALEAEHAASPERRPMQRALAFDLTARIHGRDEAERQRKAGEAVFSGGRLDDPAVLETLYGQVERFEFDGDSVRDPLELAVASGAFSSRGEARRSILQGGLSINDVRVAGLDATVPEPIAGRWLVLRVGKKRLVIGRKRE
jgi:tyrosyl-tRNA synthetase